MTELHQVGMSISINRSAGSVVIRGSFRAGPRRGGKDDSKSGRGTAPAARENKGKATERVLL